MSYNKNFYEKFTGNDNINFIKDTDNNLLKDSMLKTGLTPNSIVIDNSKLCQAYISSDSSVKLGIENIDETDPNNNKCIISDWDLERQAPYVNNIGVPEPDEEPNYAKFEAYRISNKSIIPKFYQFSKLIDGDDNTETLILNPPEQAIVAGEDKFGNSSHICYGLVENILSIPGPNGNPEPITPNITHLNKLVPGYKLKDNNRCRSVIDNSVYDFPKFRYLQSRKANKKVKIPDIVFYSSAYQWIEDKDELVKKLFNIDDQKFVPFWYLSSNAIETSFDSPNPKPSNVDSSNDRKGSFYMFEYDNNEGYLRFPSTLLTSTPTNRLDCEFKIHLNNVYYNSTNDTYSLSIYLYFIANGSSYCGYFTKSIENDNIYCLRFTKFASIESFISETTIKLEQKIIYLTYNLHNKSSKQFISLDNNKTYAIKFLVIDFPLASSASGSPYGYRISSTSSKLNSLIIASLTDLNDQTTMDTLSQNYKDDLYIYSDIATNANETTGRVDDKYNLMNYLKSLSKFNSESYIVSDAVSLQDIFNISVPQPSITTRVTSIADVIADIPSTPRINTMISGGGGGYLSNQLTFGRSDIDIMSSSDILFSNNRKYSIRVQAYIDNRHSVVFLCLYNNITSSVIKYLARLNFRLTFLDLKSINVIKAYLKNTNSQLDFIVEAIYSDETSNPSGTTVVNSSVYNSITESTVKNNIFYQVTDSGNFYAFRSDTNRGVRDIVSTTTTPSLIDLPERVSIIATEAPSILLVQSGSNNLVRSFTTTSSLFDNNKLVYARLRNKGLNLWFNIIRNHGTRPVIITHPTNLTSGVVGVNQFDQLFISFNTIGDMSGQSSFSQPRTFFLNDTIYGYCAMMQDNYGFVGKKKLIVKFVKYSDNCHVITVEHADTETSAGSNMFTGFSNAVYTKLDSITNLSTNFKVLSVTQSRNDLGFGTISFHYLRVITVPNWSAITNNEKWFICNHDNLNIKN